LCPLYTWECPSLYNERVCNLDDCIYFYVNGGVIVITIAGDQKSSHVTQRMLGDDGDSQSDVLGESFVNTYPF